MDLEHDSYKAAINKAIHNVKSSKPHNLSTDLRNSTCARLLLQAKCDLGYYANGNSDENLTENLLMTTSLQRQYQPTVQPAPGQPAPDVLLHQPAGRLGLMNMVGVTCISSRTTPTVDKRKGLLSLAMSRSFRVGWRADGKFATVGNPFGGSVGQSSVHQVRVVSVKPRLPKPVDFRVQLSPLIESTVVHDSTECPWWRSPRIDAGTRSLPLHNDHDDRARFEEYEKFLTFLSETKKGVAREIEDCKKSSSDDATLRSLWSREKAIELFIAVFGQGNGWNKDNKHLRKDLYMPLYEDWFKVDLYHQNNEELHSRMFNAQWERRREALSLWLQSICEEDVRSISSSRSNHSIYDKIFERLTCRDLNGAVDNASKQSLFHLSLLLSQLDGDQTFKTACKEQIVEWIDDGSALEMPRPLMEIYWLIGGEMLYCPETACTYVESDDDYTSQHSIINGLGWARAVGALFWYWCSINDSPQLLAPPMLEYEKLMKACDHFVFSARSPFVNEQTLTASMSTMIQPEYPNDGLYSLLQLVSRVDSYDRQGADVDMYSLLVQAARPLGWSDDSLDFSTPFIILAVLECLGLCGSGDSSGTDLDNQPAAHIIRRDLISQLMTHGVTSLASEELFCAVFVAMQIHNTESRHKTVKDLVLRHACQNESWMQRGSIEMDLVQKLKVPIEWLHEAAAYRRGSEFNYKRQQVELSKAGSAHWQQLMSLTCDIILPTEFMTTKLNAVVNSVIQFPVVDKHSFGAILLDYKSILYLLQHSLSPEQSVRQTIELNRTLGDVFARLKAMYYKDLETLAELKRSGCKRRSHQALRDNFIFNIGTHLLTYIKTATTFAEEYVCDNVEGLNELIALAEDPLLPVLSEYRKKFYLEVTNDYRLGETESEDMNVVDDM